jgi:hypothetical protein
MTSPYIIKQSNTKHNHKKFWIIALCVVIIIGAIPIVYFSFFHINDGEAKIEFRLNDNFKKISTNNYRVRVAEAGKDFDFTKYVKTNNNTDWSILDSEKQDCYHSVTLKAGENICYVVTFDKRNNLQHLGTVVKTYEIRFYVNRISHIKYVLDWDNHYSYMGTAFNLKYNQITSFYEEYTGEEGYLPTPHNPTKEGATFIHWWVANNGVYFAESGSYMQFDKWSAYYLENLQCNNELYSVYMAIW